MEFNSSLPQVMGILNVTPDSFSDGGRFTARDAALRHLEQMIAEGVDVVDIHHTAIAGEDVAEGDRVADGIA